MADGKRIELANSINEPHLVNRWMGKTITVRQLVEALLAFDGGLPIVGGWEGQRNPVWAAEEEELSGERVVVLDVDDFG